MFRPEGVGVGWKWEREPIPGQWMASIDVMRGERRG